MSRAHQLSRTAVPQGVASFLPDLAARKRVVEEHILATFRQWGYREIVPPLFEYLEVLSQGLIPETVARGYKVEDRQDGRLMVLRPDVTAQVARMAAARQEDPNTPHRFGYATNVFTHVELHRGRPREVFQAGVELMGPEGPEADAEILSLLITTLRELGLSDFIVAMGQSRYFHAILAGLALDDDSARALTEAVHRKDPSSIRTLLSGCGVAADRVELMAQIPFLIGGPEVFDRARTLTHCTDALAALDHLKRVVDLLDQRGMAGHVLVDLGEIRDLSYYTGLVFEVLVPSLGFELGGGGRYDDLVGRFGHPMAATGFALNIERVIEALVQAGEGTTSVAIQYLVAGADTDAHRAADRLRRAGLKVAVALPGEPVTAPVVVASADGALCRRMADGSEAPVTVDTLVAEG